AVVAEALLTALCLVVAVDVLARRAGGPALAADADALEGRVRRRRVALHRGRIGVAVVVDRAELEAPLRRIVAVEQQRWVVDQLRRVVGRGRGHDRGPALGHADGRVGDRTGACRSDARTPDAEQTPALEGVRAQGRHARALPEEGRPAVLGLLEGR